MSQPLRSTLRPAPQLHSGKLRKAITCSTPHAAAAAALALLLFSATPALAAPGRSEDLAETMHSAFAGFWERVAAVPGVFVGLWEEIGAAVDPHGGPVPDPPPTFGAAIDPHG